MSSVLTYDDLQAIRKIVVTVDPIKGDLEALGNDIKEIYDMITDLQKNSSSKESFSKLGVEQKILQLHADLIEAAKQAGVTLPSH